MRVEILKSIAGRGEPNYNLSEFSFDVGEVVDLEDFLAAAWCDSGIAQKAKKGAKLGKPEPPAAETHSEGV
jgi:hypothetical protein